MVDTVYVGHYIGSNAIATLTVVFPIQRLLIAIGFWIAVGSSTYASRSFGEHDVSEVKKTILTSLILTFVFITFVSVLILIFKTPLLYGLGASELTFPLAKKYLSIILIGGIFQSLATVVCYIMISFGETKALLYTNLIGVTLNIIINYIFIVKLGFGISGAAMATVLSQVMAFTFSVYKFRAIVKKFNIEFSMKAAFNSVNRGILNEIITVGFSTFIVEIADAAVAVVLNNILYKHGGDSAIVIVGLTTKISMFMFITIVGISSAMQPIIAYNYSAGNYDRVKEVLRTSIKAVTITSLMLWAMFMIFAKPIISFLLKDKILLNDAVNAFRICILLLPLVGVYYIGIYYYQAIGEAKRSFLLSIYREIVILIPLSMLFIQTFSVKGVWIAYPVTDVIVFLTSMYLLNRHPEANYKSIKRVAYKYKLN